MNPVPSSTAEPDSRESDSRLDLVTAAADLGIWDWDVLTGGMDYSPRAKAIFGFSLNAPVTLEMVRAATHPDDRLWTTDLTRRSLDPSVRERQPYEYRIVWPDGSVHWVLVYGQAVFETVEGITRATRFIGTVQDITQHKQTENALRHSNTRLRLALGAGRMAVWEYDIAKNALTGSPELNRLLGFREDEKPSLEDVQARYYPGELERLEHAGLAALQSEEHFFEVEFRYHMPDRSLRWLLVRAEIVLNAQGVPQTAIGVLLDVTDRKQHEEHLEVLLHEISHRSKNLLSVVQAMVRLAGRNSNDPGAFEKDILGRIQALARTHDLLLQEDWRGARLEQVIRSHIKPFSDIDSARIVLCGPPVLLGARAAQHLSMAIYELATNAWKHGALSVPDGRVTISWEPIRDPKGSEQLCLTWQERGGPPVSPPQRRGFGSLVLERMWKSDADMPSLLEFPAEGVVWNIVWASNEFSHASA